MSTNARSMLYKNKGLAVAPKMGHEFNHGCLPVRTECSYSTVIVQDTKARPPFGSQRRLKGQIKSYSGLQWNWGAQALPLPGAKVSCGTWVQSYCTLESKACGVAMVGRMCSGHCNTTGLTLKGAVCMTHVPECTSAPGRRNAVFCGFKLSRHSVL